MSLVLIKTNALEPSRFLFLIDDNSVTYLEQSFVYGIDLIMNPCLSVNDLWSREKVLDLGVVLYERVRSFSNRRSEFTTVAADVMTGMVLVNGLCSQMDDIGTVDPFSCQGNRYELSMSLLAVSLTFNSMQLWTRPMQSHEDNITCLIELWTLHSVVRRTTRILLDVRNGKFPSLDHRNEK